MSEEEIIKNINKTLEIINSRAFYEYVGDGSVYMTAITDLLELYKKEKEKNKGLEIKASELNGLAEVVERDYIYKDKIKEEIEHLSKNILDIENITMLKGKTLKEQAEIELYKYAICVLTRLLEDM